MQYWYVKLFLVNAKTQENVNQNLFYFKVNELPVMFSESNSALK